MTDDSMALLALIQKSDDDDFLKAVAETALQRIIMTHDVENLIGAARHERSADRLAYRNGYRERSLETRLGTLDLKIPSAAQRRRLLPGFPRASADDREGAHRGDPKESLDRRRLHPAGREPCPGHGHERHFQEPRSPSCARRSTNGSARCWIGRWKASGRTCGSTPPTCKQRTGRPHRPRWRR